MRCTLCAAAALTFACGEAPPPEWHDGPGYRWRELRVPRRGGPGFTPLPASRTGLAFSNRVSEALALQNRHLTQGSGVALGDVDGDGLVDIYLARIEGPNALYRNLGDWRFADITERAGVAAADRYSTGAVLADVDGDGDLDLLLTSLGGPTSLFLNDGSGVFTELTDDAGLRGGFGGTTMTLADVDGDGDLDLFVANYKPATVRDLYPPEALRFDRVVRRLSEDRYEVAPEFREHYRVEVRRDLGAVVRVERADPNWLYLNDGTGRFEPVPWTGGRFRDADGAPLTSAPAYFALAARFYDVNGDGAPDLYVCNDFEDPDELWLNRGDGTFQAAPALALRTTSNSSMAVDFADVNRDGHTDFFVADMLSSSSELRKTQIPTHTPLPKLIGRIADRPQMQRNTLFVSRGDGTFAEIAAYAGVEASEWSWAALFLDVDLDGYEDILVATGHLWDVMDGDTEARIRRARLVRGNADWRRERLLYPRLDLPNVAFRNNGDLTFTDMSAEWGFGPEPDISHGMATGDLDGDGDLDVVINRLGAPVGVYRNDATAGRIAVRLAGAPPNTLGVGATIRVRGGPVPEQVKEVTLGGMYLSSSDPLYSFATAGADSLVIEVRWRSGRHSVVADARANRVYEVYEGTAETAGTAATAAAPAPFFTDVSHHLDHRHHEAPYDDFARQPLLPNELSRLGPGVSWYDLDGDGAEELLLPSGRGGRLALYRATAGRWRPVALELPVAVGDQTTVLGLPNGAGGTLLLVGQASYEAAGQALPAVLGVRVAGGRVEGVSAVVPGDLASVGPLALADYDGDGDLDLFVGGRVIPGRYPAPASSRLFRNEGGQFTEDTVNSSVLRDIGLVSAALYSDIDGDGDPDLLLALEWGPIRLLRNDGGRFTDATAEWGLAEYRSRWNGLAAGDLDGDGRLDLVATSWGRNSGVQASADRPLVVYYADFDRNGTLDILAAQRDERLGAVAPLDPFERLLAAIPATRVRIRSYGAFARATLEDVLGPGLDAAARVEVHGLDHVVLLNRGGRFERHPLPPEAQFAPAFAALIADLDGDGHEDLFLSQNFFPTHPRERRYAEGRSLWLTGDGTGRLTPVPGHVSGLTVYGDQRGAATADFDGDGRLDLVVTQNGAATKLYHNQRAQPGLRVRLGGPATNPHAVGATARLVYADGTRGPARELQAGAGYWAQPGLVPVLGRRGPPRAVWVRWPGGRESETPIRGDQAEVTITMPQTRTR